MLRKISVTTAAKTLLGLFSVVVLFHVAVMAQLIDYKYTWGGRLESLEQMYVMESISLIVVGLVALLVAWRAGFRASKISPRALRVWMWIFTILFALNTLGNIVAITSLEAAIATPLTAASAVLFARLALKDK